MKTWKISLVLAVLLMLAVGLSACGSTGVKGSVILDDVPQRDVLVKLKSLDEGNASGEKMTRTGDEGRYMFTDIAPGEYLITIELEGSNVLCAFMQEELKVGSGKTATVNLDVGSEDLTGAMMQFVDGFLMYCMTK